MFLTNEKKKHSTWQGTFYTRKWNDQLPVVYFEKIYGGKPLLKKVNQLALHENLIFNSSMVDENNSEVWLSAGWKILEKLNSLERLISYPTLIVMDKNKIVRKIHTGFNGPATGSEYEKFKLNFEAFLRLLIAE